MSPQVRAQAVYQTHWDIRIRTSGTYSSDLAPRFISAIMRLTSGGNARPFRSFSAGTARAAAPGGEAAPAEPTELDVETAETRFSGVAPFSAAAPCFAVALTGRAINSSYPQRSHCHEGNTSLGSPALWYTARCDGIILPPQRGQARPRVVRRSTSILSCCAKSSKEPQDFHPDDAAVSPYDLRCLKATMNIVQKSETGGTSNTSTPILKFRMNELLAPIDARHITH